MALTPGSRFGAYEVGEKIGAGGMGEVYRATDTQLKRAVAIKVLPESFSDDADRLARFQREAEVLASLNHANIAQIYGLEEAEGRTVIVMELVDGPTLADRIKEGPIPPDEALAIARQVADALEAAHGAQVVHRDLKPANIKLKDDGTIKVLDFGIAKAIDARAISGGRSPVMTTPAVTETGVILGTAAYMSPEQARGRPVDDRTDIWAFGCLLFEMLTGQPAFGGEDVMATLARVIDRATDLSSMPGTISPAVRHTIKLCLEKDPRKRIADIRDVRLALEGVFETELPRSAKDEDARQMQRRALPSAAALLVGAVLVGIVAFALWPEPPAPVVSRFLLTPPAEAPLTNFGGYDLTISPDGTRLAYFARESDSNELMLYLRDLDQLDARPLPEARGHIMEASNLFFSADGAWVGLGSSDQVVRVPVDGGPSIKVADSTGNFLGGTTSSDGTLIYSMGNALYSVSVGGGGTPERLTPDPDPVGVYIAPVFLPGERAVLFAQGNDRAAVLDLGTREQTVLIEGAQNPTYAPTGHIVFVRRATLMAVPFDLDTLTVTGEPVALIQGVRAPAAADYALSANGTLAYVPGTTETAASAEVVWVGRDGQVVERALGEPVDGARDPRLSPDGNRLVLTTGAVNVGDLWIYELDGRPPLPLATGEMSDAGAVWSPDGAEIVFTSNDSGPWDLYVLPADGSVLALSPLRSEPLDATPAAWSAAGELILTRSPPPNLDIIATGLEPDGELRDVVVTDVNEFDAALSPNGRWLAYASERTGQVEVWVKGYPDGVPVRVSRSGGREPVWSRDGRELFYLQGSAMMAVAVETDSEFSFGAAEELFDEPYFISSNRFVRSYDVAADGRFLMIDSGGAGASQSSTSIVVVQNWFEELKRLVPTE